MSVEDEGWIREGEGGRWDLSPHAAESMATEAAAVREYLRSVYGNEDEGDCNFLIVRFVEGRAKRELPAPTEEEIQEVVAWYTRHMADQYLLQLALKGFAYIDPNCAKEDDDMGFQVSGAGQQAILKNPPVMPSDD